MLSETVDDNECGSGIRLGCESSVIEAQVSPLTVHVSLLEDILLMLYFAEEVVVQTVHDADTNIIKFINKFRK